MRKLQFFSHTGGENLPGLNGTVAHCAPHGTGVHRVALWHWGSLGPCEHQFPCSTGLHWIPLGLSRSPSTLDYLHPPWHWVPSRDLLPDWLLCMITAMKVQAVVGCLWKILLEPGLQLVFRAFLPTKAEL